MQIVITTVVVLGILAVLLCVPIIIIWCQQLRQQKRDFLSKNADRSPKEPPPHPSILDGGLELNSPEVQRLMRRQPEELTGAGRRNTVPAAEATDDPLHEFFFRPDEIRLDGDVLLPREDATKDALPLDGDAQLLEDGTKDEELSADKDSDSTDYEKK